MSKDEIIERIKNKVHSIDPTATVILYGSYARGDFNENSDIDLLILVDKKRFLGRMKRILHIPYMI